MELLSDSKNPILTEDRPENALIDDSILNLHASHSLPRLESDISLNYKSSTNVSILSAIKKGVAKEDKRKTISDSESYTAALDSLDSLSNQAEKQPKEVDKDIYNDIESKMSPMARSKSSFFIHMNNGNNVQPDIKIQISTEMRCVDFSLSRYIWLLITQTNVNDTAD